MGEGGSVERKRVRERTCEDEAESAHPLVMCRYVPSGSVALARSKEEVEGENEEEEAQKVTEM
jgi:hypothetical protein